ncbi:hypothetical protein EZV73_04050 [Acidaminobacter sp. JC074]|uniref:hypothetical protein n=1 Tax=Acidaminobacter sp. JC074 TaxID=2530199 RepID=UPI001F0CF4C4|nr:hypothetical protein [Acidaminobacter sp. JC074]MCH4886724.1 hypothetical protein [Acidaminobacter sp. JC074]
MKVNSKYTVIIVLIPIEVMFIVLFRHYGLENLFALWGIIYSIRLYRQFVDYERTSSVHVTPGLNLSRISHNPTYMSLRIEELDEISRHTSTLRNDLEIKISYLSLTMIHLVLTLIFLWR